MTRCVVLVHMLTETIRPSPELPSSMSRAAWAAASHTTTTATIAGQIAARYPHAQLPPPCRLEVGFNVSVLVTEASVEPSPRARHSIELGIVARDLPANESQLVTLRVTRKGVCRGEGCDLDVVNIRVNSAHAQATMFQLPLL